MKLLIKTYLIFLLSFWQPNSKGEIVDKNLSYILTFIEGNLILRVKLLIKTYLIFLLSFWQPNSKGEIVDKNLSYILTFIEGNFLTQMHEIFQIYNDIATDNSNWQV